MNTEANAPGPADDVAYLGGEVKALGDGKVGGYLVRFGIIDVQGDLFDADTDFGFDASNKSHIYYHHGLRRRNDPHAERLGNRKLGVGEVKALDDGLWFEGRLDMARPGIPELYADVATGRMGWSSGTADRFVIREPIAGKAACHRIVQWHLNDSSLTPTPVESRNRAVALKSLLDGDDERAAVAATLLDRLSRLVADSREVRALTTKAFDQRRAEGRDLSDDKLDALKALSPELRDLLDAIDGWTKADDAGVTPDAVTPPAPFDLATLRALAADARGIVKQSARTTTHARNG